MVNMVISILNVKRIVQLIFGNNWNKSSMRMDILQKRIRRLEISEKIDAALEEYYSEKGLPVPQWKQKRDPLWWREYLISLGLDPDNP
jgi:hypothetical protein